MQPEMETFYAPRNTKIKILDATGHKKLTKAFTGRDVTEMRADVEWRSDKTHIVKSAKVDTLKKMRPENLETTLKIALEKISGNRILLLTHKRHIKKGFDCVICHGEVKHKEKIRQVKSLRMGWCLTCHRENGGSEDCWTCHK